MKKIDKIIEKVALPIIGLATIMLLVLMVSSSNKTGEENNAYVRVINCIVSYPVNVRTQEDIEKCYAKVEKDLGIKLQRYDSSKSH